MQLTTSVVSDYLSTGSMGAQATVTTPAAPTSAAYYDPNIHLAYPGGAVPNAYPDAKLDYDGGGIRYPDVNVGYAYTNDVGGGVMGMDRIQIQQQQFGATNVIKKKKKSAISPYLRASSFSVSSTEQRNYDLATAPPIYNNAVNMSATSETSMNHHHANMHARNRNGGYQRDPRIILDTNNINNINMSANGMHLPQQHPRMNSTINTASGIPLGRLTFYEVLDINGVPITLGRLSAVARKKAILIFVPRHSIEVTALVYTKIAHLLHESGTKLIFVLPWLPIQARKFLTRFERISPFPGILVCDPDGTLFQKFGFVRSRLSTFPKILKNALTQSHNRDLPANSRMRCGVVILQVPRSSNDDNATSRMNNSMGMSSLSSLGSVNNNKSNNNMDDITIIYQSVESNTSGTACHLDVLVCCNIHGAFVPEIDADHLYRRFNNMRITCQKARQADEKELKAQRDRTNQLLNQSNRQRNSAQRNRQRTSRQRTWHG